MTPNPKRKEPPALFSRDAQTALERLATFFKLIDSEYPEIHKRFKAWSRGGFPASTGGGPGSKGAISDPTGREAIEGDDVRLLSERFHTCLELVLSNANLMKAIRDEIMRTDRTTAEAKRDTLQKCCNAFGCPEDAWAEKAGRCNACYQYRYRNGRDRTARTAEDAA